MDVSSGNYYKGLLFILLVALIWVAASFVVKDVEAQGVPAFVVTYICNALFIIYLPLHEASKWLRKKKIGRLRRRHGLFAIDEGDGVEREAILSPEDSFSMRSPVLTSSGVNGGSPHGARRFHQYRDTALLAVFFCPLCLFTYFLSVLLLSEPFAWGKLVSVFGCVLGTAFVAVADKKEGEEAHNTLAGDMLCLASAFVYACYTTYLRRNLPEDGNTSMTLFFGFVGLFNAVLLLPVLLTQCALGVSGLAALTPKLSMLIIVKGLADNVLSDYLWARAVLLTSPTVATVGMSIQIPIAVARDTLLGQIRLSFFLIVGGVIMVLGFVGLNWETSKQSPVGQDQQATKPSTPPDETQLYNVP
eukprot:jgi/Chlat1/649/Chrsp103S00008